MLGNSAVNCVSNGITSQKCLFFISTMSINGDFLVINQKNLSVGTIRMNDDERVFFREKKRFHLFRSLFLRKWGGAIHAGGSRPSC